MGSQYKYGHLVNRGDDFSGIDFSPAPSDRGVNCFIPIEKDEIPDWVLWLHRQAKLGLANRVTATQAGFTIGDGDVATNPELQNFQVVVIGYSR